MVTSFLFKYRTSLPGPTARHLEALLERIDPEGFHETAGEDGAQGGEMSDLALQYAQEAARYGEHSEADSQDDYSISQSTMTQGDDSTRDTYYANNNAGGRGRRGDRR
jgi:hypothetical protein